MPLQDAIYRFGPFELRARTRELYKNGVRLKVRPQPFQILLALLARSGDIVSREELRRLLWSAETFVDFEHGVNTAIKELRGLLNDSAGEPRYIETLPKLGYRVIVPVTQVAPIHAAKAKEKKPLRQPLPLLYCLSSILVLTRQTSSLRMESPKTSSRIWRK
jgi:DNA-binding winged helix-turn-helix (wHTH) protein